MASLLKKFLYAVVAVVVFLVVAAVLVAVLFDPNDFREDIAAEVESRTGREFVIEGDLGLSVFPWLAIDVGRTQLGNAPGFGDEPFASFERARLSVRLLPLLLRREVVIGTASLDSLHLNLAVARDGRSNWQDLVEASEKAAEAPEPGEAAGGGSVLDVAGVEISNSSLSYSDAQNGDTYRLTNLNVDTGRVKAGAPLEFTAGFDFELQPADLAGDFEIETVMQLDGDAGTVAFRDLRISMLGIGVTADVEPFSYLDEAAPVAKIRVDAFSLKSLMQRLNMAAIETADPDALGRIILDATARVSPAAITLDDLELVVDDTTFRGRLGIARDAAGTISVDLAGDSLNLDRYMAPAAEPGASGAADVVPVEIPAELIRSLNARGKLTLVTAQMSGMTFDNVELGVNSSGGKLRMNPIHAEFFGGGYEGDVRIDASGPVPVLSVNEHIHDVNVGALVMALFEQRDVSGSIDGAFQLTGRGADMAAVQKTLSGNMSFELQDGAWEGTDVWYELRRARALLKQQPPPPAPEKPRTEFSAVKLSGPVTDGVFRNDDLLAELPFMQLTGKGTVDLPKAEIDYRMTARILENPGFVAGVSEDELRDFTKAVIPLSITGPLASPSIKPDVEKLLRKEAEKKLRDQLADKLLGGGEETAGEEAAGEETTEGEPKKKKDKDKVKDALRDLLGN
jgi:AsmA protein